jgi:5-methylcytosine-specific restriction endonuclease McrA
MTKDRRAKRHARVWMAATGDSYTAARRQTLKTTSRWFKPDHCANCLGPLPPRIDRLFCGELCRQTADTVRYWRRITRDDRSREPDVQAALRMKIAHLLAGGYHRQARRLPDEVRQRVWDREDGRCRECGEPGTEVDHIAGDSPAPGDLQLLCTSCHRRRTESRMRPASAAQQRWVQALYIGRVYPSQPLLLCDDSDQWATLERQLRRERRQRLIEELDSHGYQPADFPGYSWEQMWDEALDEIGDVDDYEARGIDDDTGYGPDSYFAHAMAKDD